MSSLQSQLSGSDLSCLEWLWQDLVGEHSTVLTASSAVSVCIREMQGRKSVFVSIFILKPLRELLIASAVTSSFPRDSHSCASELRQLKT